MSVNATTATRPETGQPLEYLSEAVAAAAALQAAVRLGVLHELDAEVLSAQELAEGACGIDARAPSACWKLSPASAS